MPRGDGTGPAGQGPMIGRAAGFCAGYDGPGYMTYGRPRLHLRRGFRGGRGPGFRRGFTDYAPQAQAYRPFSEQEVSREEQINMLKQTADNLAQELKMVEERLNELQVQEE